jgi:hypothetical protein
MFVQNQEAGPKSTGCGGLEARLSLLPPYEVLTAYSVGESYDEGQCNIQPSDVAMIEVAYVLPEPCSPNRDRFVGHYLRADSQTVSPGWINGDPEVRCIHDFRGHLANDDRGMRLRKRVSLDNDRRPRFSIVSGRCNDDNIATFHRWFGSMASNSETCSIQFSASSSLFRSRHATWAATRFRTDRNRGSGTSRRNSRSPCLRRRSRIILIRSAGPGTLISPQIKTIVTRYRTDGN